MRFAWLGLVLLGACSAAGPRGPEPGAGPRLTEAEIKAAQELRQLQDQWRRALSLRDTSFFQRVLAEDFLLTGNAGTQTKPGFLHELASSTAAVPAAHQEETSIRVFGDFAIVTGLTRYDIPGGSDPIRSRHTEVWVRRDGGWRCLHGHYNPVGSDRKLETPQ